MSTFMLVGAVFIVPLIVLSRIPGVERLVKPLVNGVTWVFSTFMGGVSGSCGASRRPGAATPPC
ncbi:MAG: hypothetical protein ACYDEV_15050 [Acidiferrobacter sp.]